MQLLNIAFLEGFTAWQIAFGGMVPGLLFVLYVVFDDAREARKARAARKH